MFTTTFNMETFIYSMPYKDYRGYIMSDVSTIQLDKEIIESLKDVREYPRQTYNELIKKMVEVYKNVKKRNQYDEFLHKIQRAKMKEIWDNSEDVAWENA